MPHSPHHLGRRGVLLGLLNVLGFFGGLSCGSPASPPSLSTLWVGFGQTELDLVLTATEPPYY